MKISCIVCIAGLLGPGLLPLSAEPGVVVTLATVGQRVRAQNPDLAAARHVIDEALGRLKQAGRLSNPELEVGFGHNLGFSEGSLEVGLSQSFPVTDRLRLEKDLGSTGVMAAREEVREVENRLVGEARSALVRVLAVRERKDLLQQQTELSGELADFISEVARKGEASMIDAGQARLESSRFATESRQLAAEEQRAIGDLKPLLGMAPGETLHVSGSLPALQLPDDGSSLDRPALEVARLAVLAAEQETELERSRRYADLKAAVFAGGERVIDEPEGAENEGILGLKLTIPLPWWDKNEGNIEAAEALAARRRKEVGALERGILLEAETARAEMIEWAKLVREMDAELLPQAAEQTELAEQAWRNGQGELLTVLRAREQRLDLEAARLEALSHFHQARVRHQTVLGTP